METTTTVIALIFVVFGVLQIILFFKLWEMTNDVKRLADKIAPRCEIRATEEEPEFEDDAPRAPGQVNPPVVWKCPVCNAINSSRSFGESTCISCGATSRE